MTLILLVLALAALGGMLLLAVQGYRALSREEVAAVVTTSPVGERRFEARFRLADGRVETFGLAGDELYVDAHILKWKPLAAWLGLHTAYELDRVSGRYRSLADERGAPRTVFALGRERMLDLFHLRRRFAFLEPLVDAEYGSASFVPAAETATFEVRVSTTGLLIRRVAPAP